jgi:hypothetical protein
LYLLVINKNKHLTKMKIAVYGIRVTKKLQSRIYSLENY